LAKSIRGLNGPLFGVLMKVRAIKRGFFGGQYRSPDNPKNVEFELDSEDQFSDNWMEKVSVAKKAAKPIDNSDIKETKDFKVEPLEIPGLTNKKEEKAEAKAEDKPKRKRRSKEEMDAARANGEK